MPDANGTDLLTVAEVASLLRLKPSTVRAWVLRRRIPYVKVGRLVRVRRADVEAVIERGVVPARCEESAKGATFPTELVLAREPHDGR